jgi:hypothetical protein
MRYPQTLRRLRARSRSDEIQRYTESHRTADPLERELLEQDIEGYKGDVFVEAGDGNLGIPMLQPAEPAELYREWEHDEEQPSDPAP